MRRIPPTTHPGTVAQAEQTLAHAARRFDPTALGHIGERLLSNLDPDGDAPSEEPETMRELLHLGWPRPTLEIRIDRGRLALSTLPAAGRTPHAGEVSPPRCRRSPG